MRRVDSETGSYVFSDEEAQYLKRVMSWQNSDSPLREAARRRAALANRQIEAEEKREKPVGEFRILVIGAKGTGKTAILTRVGVRSLRTRPMISLLTRALSSAKIPSAARTSLRTLSTSAAAGTTSTSTGSRT